MIRALPVALAVAALAPATASASITQDYGYGLDAYLNCIADAGPSVAQRVNDHVACATRLANDWTDGGQVRRVPLCLRNRTVEFASGQNPEPVRTEINCIEQYLGTNIAIALP